MITYYDRAGNEISQSAAFLELTKDHERVGLDHVDIDGFDTWLDRYSTQEQAEAGHAAIVEGLRAGRWPS